MKILAIGAHPDDIEIFMYGLLAVYKKLGNEVFTLIATDGSKGSEKKNKNLSKIKKNEANLGLKELSKPIFLNIEDGELIVNDKNKKKLTEIIKKILPDLIVTHYFKDYHSDHSNLSLLVKNISSHYIPILYCDTMMGVKFDPLFYVDISKYFQDKVNAILRHNLKILKILLN